MNKNNTLLSIRIAILFLIILSFSTSKKKQNEVALKPYKNGFIGNYQNTPITLIEGENNTIIDSKIENYCNNSYETTFQNGNTYFWFNVSGEHSEFLYGNRKDLLAYFEKKVFIKGYNKKSTLTPACPTPGLTYSIFYDKNYYMAKPNCNIFVKNVEKVLNINCSCKYSYWITFGIEGDDLSGELKIYYNLCC